MAAYLVNREELLKYYLPVLYSMITVEKVSKDILLGGEFIITDEDLLKEIGWISGHFWGLSTTVHYKKVTTINKPRNIK